MQLSFVFSKGKQLQTSYTSNGRFAVYWEFIYSDVGKEISPHPYFLFLFGRPRGPFSFIWTPCDPPGAPWAVPGGYLGIPRAKSKKIGCPLQANRPQ